MSVKPPPAAEWWHEGIQFKCQGSGKCCVSHGEYGYVYMTLEDRRRMARVLGLSTTSFTKTYCLFEDGVWRLKENPASSDCLFLKNKKCSVYEGRPTQCRTWPFWPETLGARAWSREVKSFCPGVGKGRRWTKEEIEEQLQVQIMSEERL